MVAALGKFTDCVSSLLLRLAPVVVVVSLEADGVGNDAGDDAEARKKRRAKKTKLVMRQEEDKTNKNNLN